MHFFEVFERQALGDEYVPRRWSQCDLLALTVAHLDMVVVARAAHHALFEVFQFMHRHSKSLAGLGHRVKR